MANEAQRSAAVCVAEGEAICTSKKYGTFLVEVYILIYMSEKCHILKYNGY